MVMNNRLDDFEHSLLNDEASIVDTLRKVDGETELRRFISNYLYQDSRGAYSVTQEAVVAAEKRTDNTHQQEEHGENNHNNHSDKPISSSPSNPIHPLQKYVQTCN